MTAQLTQRQLLNFIITAHLCLPTKIIIALTKDSLIYAHPLALCGPITESIVKPPSQKLHFRTFTQQVMRAGKFPAGKTLFELSSQPAEFETEERIIRGAVPLSTPGNNTVKIETETSFIRFQGKDFTTETMSLVKENWQTTKPTIRERSKLMFNNDLFSDVKFVARGNGESESKQVIPAHKFVLSISSPVFEAMFYGELAETTDSIELPDCEYDSLLELFRYMYSDEVILSGSNVMGVLYLAKKYMVPSLTDKCTKFLQDHLDPSNVFSILPSAQKYEEKNLVDRCWKVID